MSTKDSSRTWTKKEVRQVVREDSIGIGTLLLQWLFLAWVAVLCLFALEARLNRIEVELNLKRIETVPVAPWEWDEYSEKYPRPPHAEPPK